MVRKTGMSSWKSLGAAFLFVWLLSVSFACSRGGINSSMPGLSNGLGAPTLIGVKSADLRSVSGLPVGIRVTWLRDTNPFAEGYYLYRDTQPIPDSEWGNVSLRVNGGNTIPQPGAGVTVSFDDLEFPGGGPTVGETYYYRLTTVNDTGDESDFSNEINYTVQEQSISGFTPGSGIPGDLITLTGTHFGTFNPAADEVHFTSRDGTVAAVIQSWLTGEITAEVPSFAVTGQIMVVIDGTIAKSASAFVITAPFLSPAGFSHVLEGQEISLTGENLGDSQGGSTVVFDGEEASPAIINWSPVAVTLRVPVLDADIAETALTFTIDAFLLEPFLLGVDPIITAPENVVTSIGEEVQLLGRHFGTSGTLLVNGVGAETLTWSSTSITALVGAGWSDGSLVVDNGFPSASIPLVMDEALFVSITTSLEGALLEAGDPPLLVEVDTNGNSDSVEFLIDGVVVLTDDDPSDGTSYLIDPADLTNTRHSFVARAHRRDFVVDTGDVFFFARVFDGDYSGDDVIDDLDRQALADYWTELMAAGGDTSADNWPPMDGNRDGFIDERDLAIVGYRWGETR